MFLNCPFDAAYQPLFDALVFTIFSCGFQPRCALEESNGGRVRYEKIISIINTCHLSIHDISRTEMDRESRLPRFNMPFELGLFLGAQRFGKGRHRDKICLILDRDRYRYQKFISDIAGQDIDSHFNDPAKAVAAVRKWLAPLGTQPKLIAGGRKIYGHYQEFRIQLPFLLKAMHLDEDEVSYADYTNVVSNWLKANPVIAAV
ncbi:MAG TPA: hypothetical protein VME47_11490 [Acetobacteraceae bacterium]|nr:hypothetical protein [Acetobacteraceae bacterium]